MSRFYNLDMKGPIKIQRVSGLPSWTAQDEGRVIYDYITQLMYFGDGNQWKAGGAYSDIPQNTILLIESDTAISGFSLLTNKDDMMVYITKGSVATGEPGGTDKSGGTWTFPNHQHTQNTHQHGVGNHTHTYSGTTSSESCLGPNICSGGTNSHNHTYSGSTNPSSGNTDSGGGDNTGSQTTPITSWRPKGRNFTRQQRT